MPGWDPDSWSLQGGGLERVAMVAYIRHGGLGMEA